MFLLLVMTFWVSICYSLIKENRYSFCKSVGPGKQKVLDDGFFDGLFIDVEHFHASETLRNERCGTLRDALDDFRNYFMKYYNAGFQLPLRDGPVECGKVGRLRLGEGAP